MADGEFGVLVKAKELAVHSFKLTSNCNRYPKKYRHSLVDKIQIKSLEIYEKLLEANRINNTTLTLLLTARSFASCGTQTSAGL